MQEAEGEPLAILDKPDDREHAVPLLIVEAGHAAEFVWEEFFIGRIRNIHTRRAYLHAVRRFLEWTERRKVDLARITPGLVGQYFDEVEGSPPTIES